MQITDRTREVVRRRIAGQSNREIASDLDIDRRTVARDLAAARLDPREIELRRREAIDQLATLREMLRPRVEQNDVQAIELTQRIIDTECRLILAATPDWKKATA